MEKGCKQFLEVARETLRGSRAAILSARGEVLRTFGEIGERGSREAESFARQGLAGQVVLLALENCPEWLEIFYGLLLAGAVPLPCEAPAAREVAACWGTAEDAPRVICRSLRGSIHLAAGGCAAAPRRVFLMKSTSGITTARRTIHFSASQFFADIQQVQAGMGIGAGDINLAAIPFSHSYGLTSLVGMLLAGGVPLVLAEDVMPRALALASRFATVFPGVPAHFRALASVGKPGGNLRLCISAAAPLSRADALVFFERWGIKVHSFYGSSECGGICYDATPDPDVPEGFVGSPLPGVQASELPAEDGLMLEVRSPAVGLGYWPAAEGDALSNGVFRPADILKREGAGYGIVGRASDIVNVGGRKVSCVNVERKMLGLPGVRDAVVFAMHGPGGRECLAACVVSALSAGELRIQCAAFLSPWEVPKHIFAVDCLPVDARGKISRAALRKKYSSPPGLPECE